jgi:hypothetical protein
MLVLSAVASNRMVSDCLPSTEVLLSCVTLNPVGQICVIQWACF